jgi:hypothetical protein
MSDWGLITEVSATMWALAEARFKLLNWSLEGATR